MRIQSLQNPPQLVEGVHTGALADGVPVAGEDAFEGVFLSVLMGEADPDRADGFLCAAAVGSGDAGDGECPGAVEVV